jgi:hypothetical protein
MAPYVVLRHPNNPEQTWANAWRPDGRLVDAIMTNATVAPGAERARRSHAGRGSGASRRSGGTTSFRSTRLNPWPTCPEFSRAEGRTTTPTRNPGRDTMRPLGTYCIVLRCTIRRTARRATFQARSRWCENVASRSASNSTTALKRIPLTGGAATIPLRLSE